MFFDYSQYVRGCLVIPGLISLFTLSILIPSLFHYVLLVIHRKIVSHGGMHLLLAILVCLFFLCMNIGRLIHGGICLVWERETDAVVVNGEIAQIEDLSIFSFPNMDSDYGYADKNGVQFVIDGENYTAITNGELAVGDYVSISYLPDSRFILSVIKLE